MRTLNLKRNHILFGFLVLTLASSKSWLQNTEDFGSRDFASVSAGNFNCSHHTSGENANQLRGCSFSGTFETSDGVTHTEYFSMRPGQNTNTNFITVKEKDPNDPTKFIWKRVKQEGEQRQVWRFGVSTSSTTTEANGTGCTTCIPELEATGEILDDMELQRLGLHAINSRRAQLEKEIQKKKDLAELEKKADKCLIKITNATSNPPKFEKLTGSDKRAERFQCRIDRIEDSDMSHQKQREEFQKLAHSMNFEDIMFSNDPDDIEMFEQLTGVTAGNGFMSNYLDGLREVHGQYENIVKQAEILANPRAYHPYVVAHAQYSMARLQDFSAAGIPPYNLRSRGGTAAFRDFSQEINTLAYRVIDRPESLLFDAPFSSFNCLDTYAADYSSGSRGRGRRTGGSSYSAIDCGYSYNDRHDLSLDSLRDRDYYDRGFDRRRDGGRFNRFSTRDDYYNDEFRGRTSGGRGSRTGRASNNRFSSSYQPGGTRFANDDRYYQNSGIWQSNRSQRTNNYNDRYDPRYNGSLAQQGRYPRPR